MSSDPKVALVTGGARRVGKGICLALHRKGFNLAIHCNQSAEEARSLMEELNRDRKDSAIVIVRSFSEEVCAAAKEIVNQTAARWGRLDLVVNNASNFISNTLDDVTSDDFDSAMNVNLKAPIFIMQAAASHLKQHKGSIINMSDLIGLKPKETHFSHSISKAALISATLNAALALAPEIRVNAIVPGCVAWPEVDPQVFDSKEKENWLTNTPLGKIGTPDDVANAVLFLSSAEANFITGQILKLDGGRGLVF